MTKRKQLNYHLNHKIWRELKDQFNEQLSNELYGWLYHQLNDKIRFQIWEQTKNNLWDHIDQIRYM